ncbi:MAG: hypothetical protein HY508_11250 [Acidobacteria bacterium]|nr:hypothetical protein [Acidobacteriota bacterium]
MKKQISTQWIVGLSILIIGGAVLGGEYYLVKWMPGHQERVREEVLKPVPYKNENLGIEIQISSGLMGSTEEFAGGVRIAQSKFMGIGPSITITSRPNPDGTHEFDPRELAKWQTDDVYLKIPRYSFRQLEIHNRDAIIIEQFKNRAMLMTARVISPERIVEINCTGGQEDEKLYLEACEDTARSLKVAGPERPPPPEPIYELNPSPARVK